MWFFRYVSGQTDKQTHKHGDCNTSHTFRGQIKYSARVMDKTQTSPDGELTSGQLSAKHVESLTSVQAGIL